MDAARPTAEGGNSGSVRGISSITDYDTVVVESRSRFSSAGVLFFEKVCKVNIEEMVKFLLKVGCLAQKDSCHGCRSPSQHLVKE